MFSAKALVVDQSTDVAVPSSFTCNAVSTLNDKTFTIPIIDVSLLTSSNPNRRSRVVQDIQDACRDWGIFMVRRPSSACIHVCYNHSNIYCWITFSGRIQFGAFRVGLLVVPITYTVGKSGEFPLFPPND